MNARYQACLTLLQRKHIKAQKDWLEACIEWILEENGAGTSNSTFANLVYEQWLMADLREISEPIFPSNIKKLKGNLNGHFCVQVLSVIDIGYSAYSQLQKHKGQELDYDDGDEEEENEAKDFFKKSSDGAPKTANNKGKWKETQSRMLLIELNDGAQTIEGIEYSSINHLKIENIEPGCKLHLSGPIQCRNSMLLLKSENIQLLGGNVESLMETKSQIDLLSGILNVEVNKDAIKTTNITVKKENVKKPVNNNPTKSVADNQKTKQNLQPKKNIHSASTIRKQIPVKKEPPKDDYFNDLDDDFMKELNEDFSNDVADDIIFQEMDIKSEQKSHSSIIKNKTSTSSATTNSKSNQNIRTNEDRDDDMEDFFKNNEDDLFDENEDDFFNNDNHFFEEEQNVFETLQNKEKEKMTKLKRPSEYVEPQPKKEICSNKQQPPKRSPQSDIQPPLQKQHMKKSIPQMVAGDNPISVPFIFEGQFKTLASKLSFDNHYELFAILSDGVNFIKILLSDLALNSLIGYTATRVQEAVANKLCNVEKEAIKKALKGAEKALEMNKWTMTIQFNKNENIYEVINMKPII
ncbi:recQ-mediated genome instability protein 1-like [Clytia hemisphaerica]|uniref:RecQ-mediated genome instability protein 1 n=1 Tax=Clytia hemisphaerica TaxID=252671 RepID=A0A7M5UY35_9CNID|eukprot:TCONS_00069873-protein